MDYRRKLSIRVDDPFLKVFNHPDLVVSPQKEISNSCKPTAKKSRINVDNIPLDNLSSKKSVRFGYNSDSSSDDGHFEQLGYDPEKTNFFPNFDGSKDSNLYTSNQTQDQYWKTEAYFRLPDNVKKAIDFAEMKSQHSQFWYKLQTLNDKIFVFRQMFYDKQPIYHKNFLLKKQKALEEKLKKEKEEYEEKMKQMQARLSRRSSKLSALDLKLVSRCSGGQKSELPCIKQN